MHAMISATLKLTHLSLIGDPNQKQYIDLAALERYRKVGGVRIEDDCVVHADRIEVLSHGVPKEIAEIEALMQ